MDKETFDICIIGGGINGCGIARDAAGRGYKVLLLEKGDLAAGTSSASTKLIHGGLRYLEQLQFGLVHKSLKERDVLMALAPHIIRPMRFILPYVPGMRPFWAIRAGVYLYDLLAGRTSLPQSQPVEITNPFLKHKFDKGIEYSDCWADDARLVVLNAMDAMARGAVIKTRKECVSIEKQGQEWVIKTADDDKFHAQMVINAAGPWAAKVMTEVRGLKQRPLRLVKGSHIIIPRLYKEDRAYILQTADRRVVFTIPYERDYTLVGTTEVDIGHDPDQPVDIDSVEQAYLKNIVRVYFNKKLLDADIIATYSGVRPLIAGDKVSATKASRDYVLDMQHPDGLPFLSVLGGKLTTYRVLAQQVMDRVDREFRKKPRHWTGREKLPGGDIKGNDLSRYIEEQSTAYPFLSKQLIRRYAMTYGTCMEIILKDVTSLDHMGEELGGGVYGHELDYLRAYEFAQTAEDVLWRRTKLGLHLDRESIREIEEYMEARAA